MAASIGRLQAVPMWEKRTQLWTGSHVRDGRILSLITIVLPMWEITTSAGILLGLINMRFGATPLILRFSINCAQFPTALLLRLWIFPWTTIRSLTGTSVSVTVIAHASHMPLFRKSTFLLPSQSALLSWLRLGPIFLMHTFFNSLMRKDTSGTQFESLLLRLLQNSESNLKIRQFMKLIVRSCSTHYSGPGFACPGTQIAQ